MSLCVVNLRGKNFLEFRSHMLDEMSQFLVHMSNIPVYSLIELVDLVNLRRIVEIAAVSFTNWSLS